MKRLLSLLTAIGLTATPAILVVACESSCPPVNNNAIDLSTFNFADFSFPIPSTNPSSFNETQIGYLNGDLQSNINDQINQIQSIQETNDYTNDFKTNLEVLVQPGQEVATSVLVEITANSGSKLLKGNNTITVDFINQIPLVQVITTTALGEFPTQPTAEAILEKIHEKNPSFRWLTEANAENITNTGALISTSDASLYSGSIPVTFTVAPIPKINLDQAIQVKNLGYFTADPTASQVLAAINNLNPGLGIEDTEITIGSATGGTVTATAVTGSRFQGSVNLTYEISEQLETAITVTNLGYFNTDPNFAQVLAAINAKNSGLNITNQEITIGSATGGTVTATAVSGSRFQGSVNLIYEISEQLATAITVTNLGYFNTDPNSTDIITAINTLNPGVNITDQEIIINTPSGGQVAVSAVVGSRFQGNVTLTYQISQQLSTAISVKNLGYFDANPTATQILSAVNNANPGLNLQASEVTIGTPSGGQVTVTANAGTRFQGTANLTYQISQQLSDAIVVKAIGYFAQDPTAAQVLAGINAANPGLNIQASEVTIGTATGGTVLATAVEGSRFQGTASLTYQISNQLSDAITVKALGYFNTDPTSVQVLAAINNLNSGLNLQASEVTIGTATGGQVIVTANNGTRFQGNATLTYQISQQLSAAIATKALGYFNTDPTATQVLTAINNLNPGLNLQTSEVTIGTAASGQVIVTANNGTRFQGNATLTYQISQQLSTVITATNLGYFNSDPSGAQVLAAVNTLNAGLNIQASEVTIGTAASGQVVMTANSGTRFQGNVTLTYQISQQLSTAIVNKALGYFTSAPTSTQILTTINTLNPGLNLQASEVTIGTPSGNQVVVTANAGTRFQGTATLTYQISQQLSAAITTKALGYFTQDPTTVQVLATVNTLNPGLNLTTQDVTIGNASGGQVILTAIAGTRFQGSTTLTYQISQQLSAVVTNTTLGYFTTDPNATQVLTAINTLNPGLSIQASEVTIGTAAGGTVTATAVAGSRFQGSVNLTYQISQQLSAAITTKALGYFTADPSSTAVITAINTNNPGLNITAQDVTIGTASGGTVVATAIAGGRFQGSANLTYQISQQLSVAIATKALGYFNTDPTGAQVITAINNANPGLNILASEVTIGTASGGAVVATAVAGSRFQGNTTLTYQISQQLSAVITTKALGYFNTDPTGAQVLAAVNTLNPTLNILASEVTIGTAASGQVVMTANSGTRFQGNVTLTYQISQQLSAAITTKALGYFTQDPNSTQVLAAINTLNPGINLQASEVTIGTAASGQVIVTANSGTRFQGNATLTYQISQQLSTVVTTTALGFFTGTPTSTQILATVNTLNPGLNILANEVTIGTPSSGSVVMTANSGTRFQGNVTLTYQISQQLSTVITTTALGYFNANPTSAQVLNTVNSLNPGVNLQASEVTIGTATGGQVTITANSGTRFQGSVNLTYQISQQLSTVITNTALGYFNATPNATQVLTAINTANPGLNLTTSDVTIGTASGGQVTATAVSNGRFQGSVNLTYQIAQALSTAVTVTNLGYFNATPNATQILAAVNSLNSGLNILASEVTVGTPSGGSVVMTANAGTRFQGNVTLTYQISQLLSTAVAITNLGYFNATPTAAQIISTVNTLNTGLNILASEVTVGTPSGGTVTMTANAGTRFQGSVNLTYAVSQQLSSAIANKALGYFVSAPTSTQVLTAINTQNPTLNIQASEITIGTASGGNVIVTANAGTRFQGSTTLTYILSQNIATVIATKALGLVIIPATPANILIRINSVNGLNINANDVLITVTSSVLLGSATVEGTSTGVYYGITTVTWLLG